ncbi:uncharacterized protein F4822DRAFT_430268 [Hypoxylon trugodes]|uniref:uncharacterized protein n=1 Tax=Hypoxylon trugodes TaxID=326681 RepID=UPI00219FBE90|nr:uncharacterized protein F4822DRAFT_430268 [Hypoxylon trugodes]KAI1387521.1 hypothetical protein F4822DRAFT_430268 [Hypoxylon trugodes]
MAEKTSPWLIGLRFTQVVFIGAFSYYNLGIVADYIFKGYFLQTIILLFYAMLWLWRLFHTHATNIFAALWAGIIYAWRFSNATTKSLVSEVEYLKTYVVSFVVHSYRLVASLFLAVIRFTEQSLVQAVGHLLSYIVSFSLNSYRFASITYITAVRLAKQIVPFVRHTMVVYGQLWQPVNHATGNTRRNRDNYIGDDVDPFISAWGTWYIGTKQLISRIILPSAYRNLIWRYFGSRLPSWIWDYPSSLTIAFDYTHRKVSKAIHFYLMFAHGEKAAVSFGLLWTITFRPLTVALFIITSFYAMLHSPPAPTNLLTWDFTPTDHLTLTVIWDWVILITYITVMPTARLNVTYAYRSVHAQMLCFHHLRDRIRYENPQWRDSLLSRYLYAHASLIYILLSRFFRLDQGQQGETQRALYAQSLGLVQFRHRRRMRRQIRSVWFTDDVAVQRLVIRARRYWWIP